MLQKETFKNALLAIQKQDEMTDQLNQIYCELNPGHYGMCFDGLLLSQLITVLAEAMDDIGDTIEWWLYESSDDKTVSWEEDGTKKVADLTTPDALYEFLASEAQLRQEKAKKGP